MLRHRIRDELARLLALPVDRVRVIAPDVGGGFGVKGAGLSRGGSDSERLVWVDDAGTIVNPLLADGQLEGLLAQAWGQIARLCRPARR